MSTVPLSGVNQAFLVPSRFPAFHLKCPAFLAYFELEKMHYMRSFQRQVELRRLGNQLLVFGKANSLFKLVECCVFCLFVKLRLSPHYIGPGIMIPGYRSTGKIHVSQCSIGDALRCAPWRWENILTTAFYAFSSALSRFFVR